MDKKRFQNFKANIQTTACKELKLLIEMEIQAEIELRLNEKRIELEQLLIEERIKLEQEYSHSISEQVQDAAQEYADLDPFIIYITKKGPRNNRLINEKKSWNSIKLDTFDRCQKLLKLDKESRGNTKDYVTKGWLDILRLIKILKRKDYKAALELIEFIERKGWQDAPTLKEIIKKREKGKTEENIQTVA